MNPLNIVLRGDPRISYTADIGPNGNVHITGTINAPQVPAPPSPIPSPAPVPMPPTPAPPASNGHPIIKYFAWQPVSEIREMNFSGSDVLAVNFVTGPIQSTPCRVAVAEYGGALPTRMLCISAIVGAFLSTPLNISQGKNAEVWFTIGPNTLGLLALEPNTGYWANMRNIDGDGGYVINLHTQ